MGLCFDRIVQCGADLIVLDIGSVLTMEGRSRGGDVHHPLLVVAS